jgi:hypothetical protein
VGMLCGPSSSCLGDACMAVFQQKAYVAGCVCQECRVHQRLRMAKNRGHDQYDGRVYRTC